MSIIGLLDRIEIYEQAKGEWKKQGYPFDGWALDEDLQKQLVGHMEWPRGRDFSTCTSRELRKFIIRYKRLKNPPAHRVVAEELGVSRQYVDRIIREWRAGQWKETGNATSLWMKPATSRRNVKKASNSRGREK